MVEKVRPHRTNIFAVRIMSEPRTAEGPSVGIRRAGPSLIGPYDQPKTLSPSENAQRMPNDALDDVSNTTHFINLGEGAAKETATLAKVHALFIAPGRT
jgi:hypothetical protein